MKDKIYKSARKYITGDTSLLILLFLIAFLLIKNNIGNKDFDMSSYLDLTIVASFVILAISDLIAKFIRTMIDNKYEDLAKVKIDSYYLTKKYPLMKIIKENTYESDKVKHFPTVPIISRKMHEPAFNLDISDRTNSFYELPEQIKK